MRKNEFFKILKKSKIVVIEHKVFKKGGPGQDVKKYFLGRKVSKLLFIAHPLYPKDTKSDMKNSFYEHYSDGKFVRTIESPNILLLNFIPYIKDFFYSIYWCINLGHYDIFLGLDPLNALSGIILKALGFCDKVVYYSIDYYPIRFENKVLNRAYHFIDKVCVRFSDETWNAGQNMSNARAENNNMSGLFYKRQFLVPIGIWVSKYKRKILNPRNNKLIYAGYIAPYMGVKLVIETMQKILKEVPDASLDIIGMGEEKEKLKELVKRLGLEKKIYFYQWISDRSQFEEKLSEGAIGLAPFNPNIQDGKIKNGDPGKVKDYMLCGLPVIVTKVLFNYKDIDDSKSGIVINYNKKELSEAVIKLLKNRSLLQEYRENASKYIRKFDWNVLLDEALIRLLK